MNMLYYINSIVKLTITFHFYKTFIVLHIFYVILLNYFLDILFTACVLKINLLKNSHTLLFLFLLHHIT